MRKYFWISFASFLAGIFLAGFVFVYLPEKKAEQKSFLDESSSPGLSSQLFASSAPETRPDLDFAGIAEKVGPAVVKIEAERVEKRGVMGLDEWPFDDLWDRFFGQPRQREQEYRSTVQGTGFFISGDGYIITNNHIVERSRKITIQTLQGDFLTAKVIGADRRSDLALLKVDIKNQLFAELGNSSQARVGEWVLAIGNPLGLEHTVTAGIISAKGRQLGVGLNVPQFQDFIQTDAAINQGNSGGPLVNMKGEVIGITSNIISTTGGNIGIGLAIPSDLAKKVVTQLKEKGRVVRGYLGIVPTDIDEEAKEVLKLKDRKGALVSSVEPGTPADKAGLKQYDVIVEINGQSVENENDLRFKIADVQPGIKVEIKVIRDGQLKSLTATVAELEEESERQTPGGSDKDIGLTVTPLTPSIARRYGYRTQEGLLVAEVQSYSEADRKGIEAGDIILEVNRKKVSQAQDLENILGKLKSGDAIMLLIRRESDGQSADRIVTLRIP
jgi:serine protease Do